MYLRPTNLEGLCQTVFLLFPRITISIIYKILFGLFLGWINNLIF